MQNGIGILNEKPLHAALKAWYGQPGDAFEAQYDGYVIDILRDELLIEIQTANFSAIKKKLTTLVADHCLRLVYPIAAKKWIVKIDPDRAEITTRRKSPKVGRYIDLFYEMVRIPKLALHPNFSLEVLLIEEEEHRRFDANRAWRRKGWVTEERFLLQVTGQKHLQSPLAYLEFLPGDLPGLFTTRDLASIGNISKKLASKVTYCLREMGVIHLRGKKGRSFIYSIT